MTTERQIQTTILGHIGARPYLRVWRQNTGAMQVGDRFVRFGINGAADITGVLACGMRLELEVKRPGGKQSKDQRRFQGVMDAMGALYAVVDSVESVDRVLALHVGECLSCGARTNWTHTENDDE